MLGGQRTYRQTHDCSVIVDDRSDPRTHTCQIFRIRDGQPVMAASLEDPSVSGADVPDVDEQPARCPCR